MGMQSLRFRHQDTVEGDIGGRPPGALTFGICLLAGAATVAIMLAAVRLGLVNTLAHLLM